MTDERDAGLRQQLVRLGDRAIAGWKVGLTSGVARDSMGPGFRPFGFILAERAFDSSVALPLTPFRDGEQLRVGVENELCFALGARLGAGATVGEAKAAIASVAAAFEINEQRLPRDANVTERLADGLNQWGIVCGKSVALDWQGFDFAGLRVALSFDDKPMETVAAAGHIDDHFQSIAALARQLALFGRELKPGDRVITGSYTRQRVAGPGCWVGDFGPDIGQVSVEFT